MIYTSTAFGLCCNLPEKATGRFLGRLIDGEGPNFLNAHRGLGSSDVAAAYAHLAPPRI